MSCFKSALLWLIQKFQGGWRRVWRLEFGWGVERRNHHNADPVSCKRRPEERFALGLVTNIVKIKAAKKAQIVETKNITKVELMEINAEIPCMTEVTKTWDSLPRPVLNGGSLPVSILYIVLGEGCSWYMPIPMLSNDIGEKKDLKRELLTEI